MLRPFRSYIPLWQAHQICWTSLRYCTVQLRWVQVADMARYSPSAVRISKAGFDPKRKILALFGFNSVAVAATTESTPMLVSAGGIKYRSTGYRNEPSEARMPPPRNALRKVRRGPLTFSGEPTCTETACPVLMKLSFSLSSSLRLPAPGNP